MTDPDFLNRVAAAFASVVADAVALDRHRIGAWLRERGHADLARAVEHGDHLDDDQPATPSLRLVIAARDMHMQRADDAEAEVKRLRDIVREAYREGWHAAPYEVGGGNVDAAWRSSCAHTEVSHG